MLNYLLSVHCARARDTSDDVQALDMTFIGPTMRSKKKLKQQLQRRKMQQWKTEGLVRRSLENREQVERAHWCKLQKDIWEKRGKSTRKGFTGKNSEDEKQTSANSNKNNTMYDCLFAALFFWCRPCCPDFRQFSARAKVVKWDISQFDKGVKPLELLKPNLGIQRPPQRSGFWRETSWSALKMSSWFMSLGWIP